MVKRLEDEMSSVKVLLATTCSEQSKVEHVYHAISAQLPDGGRLAAVMARVQKIQEAQRGL